MLLKGGGGLQPPHPPPLGSVSGVKAFYIRRNVRALDVYIHVTIEMTLYVRCHDAHSPSDSRSGDSLEEVIRRSTPCSKHVTMQ